MHDISLGSVFDFFQNGLLGELSVNDKKGSHW